MCPDSARPAPSPSSALCPLCRAAQPPPDPSPLSSRGFGGGGFGGDGGGGGGFGYDTPANQPAPMRLLHSGGGGVGRHLSGGGGLMGRQALQNDKRQSLGLGFQCARESWALRACRSAVMGAASCFAVTPSCLPPCPLDLQLAPACESRRYSGRSGAVNLQ